MLADLTGGNIERVDPVSLTTNFNLMASEPIIATNVSAQIKLHKALEFRNERAKDLSQGKSLLTKKIGNVTDDTEITFEYRLKSLSTLLRMKDINLTKMKHF